MNKTKIALSVAAATLTMTGALVSPQAIADDARVDALEAQVGEMSQMLKTMQDELNRVRTAASRGASESTAKVQELDQWMASVKAAPASARSKDNMVFFRGGWADQDHTRSGVSIPAVGRPVGLVDRGDDQAWYVGAGFDFSLDDDLFGLMDNTEVLAELMFEWKDFGSSAGVGVSSDGGNLGAPNLDGSAGVNATLTSKNVSVSQFTITASPKIKFMKGSALRPWIIPAGLAFHVISPPSEAITVFTPGMMFAAGADYNLWENIYVGVDARYHLTSNNSDGVNVDGYTAGGYIGIGF